MGITFRYIADTAIERAHTRASCRRCERDVKSFEINGFLDEYADNEVEWLCIEFIRSIPLRQLWPKNSERPAQSIISQHYDEGELIGEQRFNRAVEICDELRRTPNIPRFLQGEDWPFYCGEYAEYIGESPAETDSHNDYDCWDNSESFVVQFKLEAYYPLEKMESMKSVAIFHCPHCTNQNWVFQYSRVMWPGPLRDCHGHQ